MKSRIGGIVVAMLFLFFLTYSITEAAKSIVINEIFPNPKGSDRGKEFIELYNSGSHLIELEGWFLKKTSKKGKIKKINFKENNSVKGGEYFNVKFSGLNNDGAKIELININEEIIDRIEYDSSVEGKSYNRDEKNVSSDWYWSQDTGGKKNIANPINKTYSKLMLSEILANPSGDEKSKEFIEIYNPGEKEISLEGWQLRDGSSSGIYTFPKAEMIKDDGYFVIYRTKFKFALNNSGEETVKLIAPNNTIKDEVKFKNSKEDVSHNYNLAEQRWWGSKFLTPGKVNKFNYLPTFIVEIPNKIYENSEAVFMVKDLEDIDEDQIKIYWDFGDGHKSYRQETEHKYKTAGQYVVTLVVDDGTDKVKKEYNIKVEKKEIQIDELNDKVYPGISINEILPNPKGVEKTDEFIELYNPSEKDIDLENWVLKDGSKTGQYIFKGNDKIEAKKYFVIYRKKFKFALNNSKDGVKLIAPNGKIKSEVYYEVAKENISYNFDLIKSAWQWNKFLTPGNINKFNNLPTFKVDEPKKVYKNIYVNFRVSKLKDEDGDKIKVVWDFGDGHKSYLKETRHKYKKTGKYKVKLLVKDGSGEILKEFKIRVRKYPKYKLKIVGFMPNPEGKDRGKEIILIKNLGKKKVCLEDYKIGTGKNRNRIIGHPFYKNIKIKSGGIKKVINDESCKFSLLNKNGVVQILYPNGKIADEVIYYKNKIFSNEMYKFDEKNDQWYWQGGGHTTKHENDNYESIENLGTKVGVNADITLDSTLGLCKTVEQIKKDNWMNNWMNKWLF